MSQLFLNPSNRTAWACVLWIVLCRCTVICIGNDESRVAAYTINLCIRAWHEVHTLLCSLNLWINRAIAFVDSTLGVWLYGIIKEGYIGHIKEGYIGHFPHKNASHTILWKFSYVHTHEPHFSFLGCVYQQSHTCTTLQITNHHMIAGRERFTLHNVCFVLCSSHCVPREGMDVGV